MHRRHIEPGNETEMRRALIDSHLGILLANVVFYFIVLTTAATLFPAGIHEIVTARDAAEALRPLAGDHAATLFAIGFIGTGLRSIPVLAGSAASGVAEVFDRAIHPDRAGDRAVGRGRHPRAVHRGGRERHHLAGLNRGDPPR
jgi:Mn2+/Fe2+ NRAMP family transporter